MMKMKLKTLPLMMMLIIMMTMMMMMVLMMRTLTAMMMHTWIHKARVTRVTATSWSSSPMVRPRLP